MKRSKQRSEKQGSRATSDDFFYNKVGWHRPKRGGGFGRSPRNAKKRRFKIFWPKLQRRTPTFTNKTSLIIEESQKRMLSFEDQKKCTVLGRACGQMPIVAEAAQHTKPPELSKSGVLVLGGGHLSDARFSLHQLCKCATL